MSGIDFAQRSRDKELMDTEAVSFEEFHDCLRNLEVINIYTLAYRPTLNWLKTISRLMPGQKISVLDIGSGGGDMLRKIWKWAEKNQLSISLTGVDINPFSKRSSESATPLNAPIIYKTVDLFSLNSSEQPDVIISSLFTHHLSNDELIRFIKWMDTQCTAGWHINDLHRHPIPYYFIKCLTRILPVNRLVKNDAAVSVARAFTKKDWKHLLREARIPESRAEIIWYFPFRYSVSCLKA